jgi:catechol 2,3-dioxygenase-like lactoylglutathione lyase family enzyme
MCSIGEAGRNHPEAFAAMAKVTDISGLILKTPKLEPSVEFYEKCWGLKRIEYPGTDTVFFKGASNEPFIFGLEAGEQRSVSMIRLTLDSAAAVDSMHDDLKGADVEILNTPDLLQVPGNYYGFQFKDPDGTPVELSTLDDGVSADTPGEGFLPRRLSHLVLNSTDNRALRDFYIRYLDFELADWYAKDAFFFLRCNEQHHCLGLEKCDNSSLNHVAFLLEDLDAVMRFTGRMANMGITPLWGPGRHGPGGNCFCYFEDPAGYVLEATAELIFIPVGEEWVPREWQPGPENANVWLTGGRTERAIQLMSNH